MSSFVAINTLFTDLAILCVALQELGHAVSVQAKEIRGEKGCTESVDFVVSVAKAKGVDIGFKKLEDGTFQCVADWDALERAGVSQKAFVDEVAQKYAYLKTIDEAQKQGYRMVEEKSEVDGSIKVILRKY